MISVNNAIFLERIIDAMESITLDLMDKEDGELEGDVWSAPIVLGKYGNLNIVLGLTDAELPQPIGGSYAVKQIEHNIGASGKEIKTFDAGTANEVPLSPGKIAMYYSVDYPKLMVGATKTRSYMTQGYIKTYGAGKPKSKRVTFGRVDTMKYSDAIAIARYIQEQFRMGIDPTTSPDYMRFIASIKSNKILKEGVPPWAQK
ncbi:hypothetical protein vBAcoSR7M_6 [Alteromonas phage vB_AcoS-R7M]|uniref:Uncharacterized protein n=1 Tax=Alteromonas phage vB_AcoS-R7M TaxID=2729541 RepID=A0A6M3YP48_9CAUD|nr:hypothetical protein HWD34_gp06 [Alteromonas phage vB_AcoS-R7M]QJI53328.1 hypothetical protein vBAcoSR7M_6 [Alteromonas phage vB_AcoS-R7M]